MSFEEKIQQWVSLDNQIKTMNTKLTELREKRTEVNTQIHSYANKNNLQNATIQISDGKLRFTETKVSTPLTFKYLEKCLGEVITNEAQVKHIMEYIKEKRETKLVPEIKRFS